MKPTEENHSTQSPGEGYEKVPYGPYLWYVLVRLYAKQEGFKATWTTEDVDGSTINVSTDKPFPGSKWTYRKIEEEKK